MSVGRSALVPTIVLLIVAAGCADTQSPVNSIELQPGDTETVLVSTHCGYESLEIDINNLTWTTADLGTDEAGNPTEAAWPNDEAVRLQLELIDATTLEVTVPGTGIIHTYHPDANPLGCA